MIHTRHQEKYHSQCNIHSTQHRIQKYLDSQKQQPYKGKSQKLPQPRKYLSQQPMTLNKSNEKGNNSKYNSITKQNIFE